MKNDGDGKRPVRQKLPHDPPVRIDPSRAVFFITVCCAARGVNTLAIQNVALPLIETVKFRNEKEIWWCSSFVVMPDHVHGLFTFPNYPGDCSMKNVMRAWKGWTAKRCGIRWQRDWFDHRLRSDESDREKSEYIWNNPVRAGLVKRAEDWPYRFMADR